MALTAADKKWIRTAFRDELQAQLQDMAAASTGGYDGATNVPEEAEDEESRKRAPRQVGFTVPRVTSHARRTLLRKLNHGN